MARFFTNLLIISLGLTSVFVNAGRLYAPELNSLPASFNDKAWGKIKQVTMQSTRGAKLNAPHRVWAKFGIFKSKLIVGLLAEKDKGQQLVANIKNDDGKVYLDDCFEIFIARQYASKAYYHFVVNANGAKLTESAPGKASNYPWHAKTIVDQQSWSAIITLPLKKVVKGKVSGKMVMLKIFRASPRKGVPSAGVFPCMGGGFHAVDAFGEIVLGARRDYYKLKRQELDQSFKKLLKKTQVGSTLHKETSQLAKKWEKEAAQTKNKELFEQVLKATKLALKRLSVKIHNQCGSFENDEASFSLKKSFLSGNIDKNIKKTFAFDKAYPAVTVHVSVDPNIPMSDAIYSFKNDQAKQLAWMRMISNGGWTYIQFSGKEKAMQVPTYTKNSALCLRMTYLDSGIIKLEWKKAASYIWHELTQLNTVASPAKITLAASRDAIIRNIYSQTLVNNQVKLPFKTGEKLSTPLGEGSLEFYLPSTELVFSTEVQINPKFSHSGGTIYLSSKDGKSQAWLKALSNGGWTYLQYGFNKSGIKTVKTFTRNDNIKLRILYSTQTDKFSFEWGKATEKNWTVCASLKAPQKFIPQACIIAVIKNGIIKSLKLNYLDEQRKAAISVNSLNEYNKKLAEKNKYRQLPFSASFCTPDFRLYPDLPFTKKKISSYKLWLCGGERQSFQLLLLPWKQTGKINVELEWPGIDKYIELGQVAHADISKYNYSKILGTNKIPDPIINYKAQAGIALSKISPNEQTAVFITIDLPTNFPAGEYPGKVKIYNSDNKQELVMPVHMKVFPFSINRNPNLAFPYSDTAAALAAYTGYLRTNPKGNRYSFKINNAEAYFDSVKQVSEDLVKHRVSSSRMSVCFIPPWFIGKKEAGKWTWDGSFFEKTLKVMFKASLQKVVIDEFSVKNAADMPRVKAFLNELNRIVQANNWQDKIIIKIGDEPRKEHIAHWIKLAKIIHKYNLKVTTSSNHYNVAKKLFPYLDIYHGHVGDEKKFNLQNKPFWPYFNHMTLQSSLSGARSAVWKCNAAGADVYSYYAHNLWVFWNQGNPWNKMDSYVGLGETFRVYPPKNMPSYFTDYKGPKVPFKVISSLRWEATTDAITDWLYIKEVRKSIAIAEKAKNIKRVKAGREILKSFITKFSTILENDFTYEDLAIARKTMAEYISN